MAQLAMMLGGRAAERVVFDEITTGASNDLERVTQTARQMVTRFGMSEKLGPMALGHQQGQVFMGRDFNNQPDYSDEIAFQIDKEIGASSTSPTTWPRTCWSETGSSSTSSPRS